MTAQGRCTARALRPGIESGSSTANPVELTLAGYNAGPGAVQRLGTIAP
nr:hypothetical protein [Rhodococcus sp. (in: high G+C Gram-positive bacteria)]